MAQMGYIRVATAIPHVKIGSYGENSDAIELMVRSAAEQGVEVIVTPELSITGYTCGDLFMQSTLIKGAMSALEGLILSLKELEIVAIVGMPIKYGSSLYNCAVAISKGEVLAITPKSYLPNYSEFYEQRWFASGAELSHDASVEILGKIYPISTHSIFTIKATQQVNCAIEICEDLWVSTPPSSEMAAHAELIFNLSATPEVVGKHNYLRALIEQQSARCMAGYVYCSAGWGESSTDLLFAGNGIIAENGQIIASSERFTIEPQLTVADIDIELLQNHRLRTNTFRNKNIEYIKRSVELTPSESDSLLRKIVRHPFVPSNIEQRAERCQEIFAIQSGGLMQRLAHTRCKKAIIGISGGLDSTLALLVTVRAFDRLGIDRSGIIGVTMPGFGTTGRTYNNAVAMVNAMGVTLREISIKAACYQHFSDIGLSADDRSVSYENSQARERTQILMDLANMEGGMVIGTGDLSELALGWATYNGDHMSMYGVNSSVPKSLVRYLVKWVAEQYADEDDKLYATLCDVIDTPVSPELLPADEAGDIAQKTEDLVGPYELHDFFLYNFIRNGFSPTKILYLATLAFEGLYDPLTVKKWLRVFIRRFFAQQFKRSAMPDGVKVGSVSLSPRGDWRMPSDATSTEWLTELE